MKIGERASLLYERAAMELTSLVSGMTVFAANLYPLKTEEELVALLSGMHHRLPTWRAGACLSVPVPSMSGCPPGRHSAPLTSAC